MEHHLYRNLFHDQGAGSLDPEVLRRLYCYHVQLGAFGQIRVIEIRVQVFMPWDGLQAEKQPGHHQWRFLPKIACPGYRFRED